jgi:hypothetical protein
MQISFEGSRAWHKIFTVVSIVIFAVAVVLTRVIAVDDWLSLLLVVVLVPVVLGVPYVLFGGVKDVRIEGDWLVVSDGSNEVKVLKDEVRVRIGSALFRNPPINKLYFKTPTVFGSRVRFMTSSLVPPYRYTRTKEREEKLLEWLK